MEASTIDTSLRKKIYGCYTRLLRLATDTSLKEKITNVQLYRGQLCNTYQREVITYIAGFVVKSLKSTVTCPECNSALYGDNFSLLIDRKTCGGLTYPSVDVINICILTDKIIKLIYMTKQKKMLI